MEHHHVVTLFGHTKFLGHGNRIRHYRRAVTVQIRRSDNRLVRFCHHSGGSVVRHLQVVDFLHGISEGRLTLPSGHGERQLIVARSQVERETRIHRWIYRPIAIDILSNLVAEGQRTLVATPVQAAIEITAQVCKHARTDTVRIGIFLNRLAFARSPSLREGTASRGREIRRGVKHFALTGSLVRTYGEVNEIFIKTWI